jgi:hypothetical protein
MYRYVALGWIFDQTSSSSLDRHRVGGMVFPQCGPLAIGPRILDQNLRMEIYPQSFSAEM